MENQEWLLKQINTLQGNQTIPNSPKIKDNSKMPFVSEVKKQEKFLKDLVAYQEYTYIQKLNNKKTRPFWEWTELRDDALKFKKRRFNSVLNFIIPPAISLVLTTLGYFVFYFTNVISSVHK
jgi:membrane-bound ClpP family serine protease